MLGRGGFGKVLLVRRKSTKELFAMKKIKLQSSKDKQLALREGRTLFELQHPNVVHAISFFEKRHWFKQNKVGIVMEFCDGGDLWHTIIRRAMVLEEVQILSIMLQASAGLVYLHDKGVLHRDIKPENILLQRIGGTGDKGSEINPVSSNGSTHEALLLEGVLYRVKISDLGLIAKLAPLEDLDVSESMSEACGSFAHDARGECEEDYSAGDRLDSTARLSDSSSRKGSSNSLLNVPSLTEQSSHLRDTPSPLAPTPEPPNTEIRGLEAAKYSFAVGGDTNVDAIADTKATAPHSTTPKRGFRALFRRLPRSSTMTESEVEPDPKDNLVRSRRKSDSMCFKTPSHEGMHASVMVNLHTTCIHFFLL